MTIRCAALVVFCFVVSGGLFDARLHAAPTGKASLADLGVQAYADGRFADAAAAWRQAWDDGAQNASLACNLGNAAFRQRRLGEAVLWYRRALWLDPGHADARHNLEFARQFLADRVPPPPPSFLGAAWAA